MEAALQTENYNEDQADATPVNTETTETGTMEVETGEDDSVAKSPLPSILENANEPSVPASTVEDQTADEPPGMFEKPVCTIAFANL